MRHVAEYYNLKSAGTTPTTQDTPQCSAYDRGSRGIPVKFKSDMHQQQVLSVLKDFRETESFCDVILVAQGQQFRAHRTVLASCSTYFRVMFTSEMLEKKQNTIELHGVSAIGLEAILDYVYSSEVTITLANVFEVLPAAHHLQVMTVIKFCSVFLKDHISAQNCMHVSEIALFFSLNELKDAVHVYIIANCAHFVQTPEFLQISEGDICALLSSDNIRGLSEIELFEAARKWLSQIPARLRGVNRVMEHIRFPLISPKDLDAKVRCDAYIQIDPALLLEASRYHMLPHKQPVLQTSRTKVRSIAPSLVTVGCSVVQEELKLFNKEANHWRHLAGMKDPSYFHCVAALNNFLYVVGGQKIAMKSDTAVSNVYRYDPRFNKWMRMSSMRETRTRFHMSAIDGFLYATAGVNQTGPLRSAERFIVDSNRWEPIADLPHPVSAHSGAACQGRLYIAGGYYPSHGRLQRQMHCYYPLEKRWEEKPQLKTARAAHCMVTLGDHLYCIGGNKMTRLGWRDVLSTEVFDVNTEQWTEVAPLFDGRSKTGAAVVGAKIYVGGGYDSLKNEYSHDVACYDPELNVWASAGIYSKSLRPVSCCALRIPVTQLAVTTT